MNKKVVLITGASSGFGMETAKVLLERNWVVYAAARRTDRMAELEEMGAHLLKMDVTKDEDVENGVVQIIAEQGRIDALLANAGYGTYGMVESVPLDEIKYQYEVNVFGVARTVKAVLPQMRKQRSGNIAVTASVVSNMSMMALGWYASTKHALKAVVNALRQEVQGLGIHVSSIEPGVVRTGFEDVAYQSMDRLELPDEYKEKMSGFKKYFRGMYKRAPGPQSTVKCMVDAVTSDKPKAFYRTTADAKVMPALMNMLPRRISDGFVLGQVKKAGQQA